MTEYPEHQKLKAIQPEAQACGDFVHWLEERGYSICRHRVNVNGDWQPVIFTLENLLAERFEIDLNVIEKEKCAMLEAVRDMQSPKPYRLVEGYQPSGDGGSDPSKPPSGGSSVTRKD